MPLAVALSVTVPSSENVAAVAVGVGVIGVGLVGDDPHAAEKRPKPMTARRRFMWSTFFVSRGQIRT
jgi:hypothetical protein